MSNHLSLRSGKPVLKANTFIQRQTTSDNGTMTITGTVNKTALGLLLLMTTAIFTWNMAPNDPRVGGLMMVGIFVVLMASIVTVFKGHFAPDTTPMCALL